MQIFNPYDFPDATSGSLLERSSPPGYEIFLGVTAQVSYAEREVLKYDFRKVSVVRLYERRACLKFCRETAN